VDFFKWIDRERNFTPTDNAGNELPDFGKHDAPKQRQRRSLKADGQAGHLAYHMLIQTCYGTNMTVMDAFVSLKGHGMSSNDPGRRLREAREWLQREGLEVISEWHTNPNTKVRYQSWRIKPDADKQARALARLKGVKHV
jgi:hypothetical protein